MECWIKEIYMVQPSGYIKDGEEYLVCKLKRSLYGLKQSYNVGALSLQHSWSQQTLSRVVLTLVCLSIVRVLI